MAYRVPVLHKFSWQEPISGIVNEPTVTTKGTRYVVGAAPAGDFATFLAGQLVWADADGHWTVDIPAAGWRVFNKTDNFYYTFNGTTWSSSQAMNGLTLTGDVSSTDTAIDWDLQDDVVDALSFDTDGQAGILAIDTVDGLEKVKMSKDLTVAGAVTIGGNLTVQGDVTYLQTTNTDIKDKIITLNKGGIADSANGAGIEFEEDVAGTPTVTGYIKVAADRLGYDLEAPGSTNVLNLTATANAVVSVAGNLTVEAASIINQDVTTDATPTFAGVTISGTANVGTLVASGNISAVDATLTGNVAITGTLAAGATSLASLGVVADQTIGGTLGVTGNSSFSTASFSGDITTLANLTNGTDTVTVANLRKSYDSRAKWDSQLGCVVFDESFLDLA